MITYLKAINRAAVLFEDYNIRGLSDDETKELESMCRIIGKGNKK